MTRQAQNMTRATFTRHDASAATKPQVMTHMTRPPHLPTSDATNTTFPQVMTHMPIYDACTPTTTTNVRAHTQVRDTNPAKRVIASYASCRSPR